MKSKSWTIKRSYDGHNKHSSKYEYSKTQPLANSAEEYAQYPQHCFSVLPPQPHNAPHYRQMAQNSTIYSSPPPMWPMRTSMTVASGQQLPFPHPSRVPHSGTAIASDFPTLDPTSSQRNSSLPQESYSRNYTSPPQTFSPYASTHSLLSCYGTTPQVRTSFPKAPFPYTTQSSCETYSSELVEVNPYYGAKVKKMQQPAKKKKIVSENTTLKEWKRKDALKAFALEERFCKRNSNPPTLILRFPDPPLDRDIVKDFSPYIEGVHFQQNFASRYCFVRLKKDADVEKTIEEISNVPFGTGFVTAELRRVVTKQPSSTNIERVDPYSLYIGNLPRTVSVANVKEHFPGAQRYDVAHSQKTWPSQYAFVRYRTVLDAMRAFAQSVNKTIESRSLVIRFRRTKTNFALEEPLSEEDVAIIDAVINAESDEFDDILQLKESSLIDKVKTQNVNNATSITHCSTFANMNTFGSVEEPSTIDRVNQILSGNRGNGSGSVSDSFANNSVVKQEPTEEDTSPVPIKEEDAETDEKFFENEELDKYGPNFNFSVYDKRSEIKSEFDGDSYDDDFMYESDEDFGIANSNITKRSGKPFNTLHLELRSNDTFNILGQPIINTLVRKESIVINKNEDEINQINMISEEDSFKDSPPKQTVYENSFVTSVVKHIVGLKQEDVRESNFTTYSKNLDDTSNENDLIRPLHLENVHGKVDEDVENVKVAIKEE